MATAHKVMVTVRTKSGKQFVLPFSTTDLNTAFLLSPSGASDLVYSPEDSWIIDLVHSTQGTCTQDKVYFNGALQGYVIYTPNSLPTVNRQVRNCPIYVPGGTRVSIQQAT